MHTLKRASVGFAIFTLLVALVSLAADITPAAAATKRPGGKLVPSYGAHLGAYSSDGAWRGNNHFFSHFSSRERLIGRKFDIDHHFYSWNNRMPNGLEKWDLDGGRIPMITWEPTVGLDAINNGSQDGLIASKARGLKSLGKELFVRWGHEMNGTWYKWGGPKSNDPGRKNGPAKYVQAWRRVVNIFRSQGAHNVVWVWQPGAANHPNEAWNHWTKYYPGDNYVDWVGISGYNWGQRYWPYWTNFADKFAGVYNDYASRKPIMIAETASTERGGNKGQWIRDAAHAMKTRFPSVAAIVWFDVKKEEDWRIDSSGNSLNAFRSMAHDPHFKTQSRR